MKKGRQAITRQAATRLFFSLGLFMALVGGSTALIYQAAISKAAHESADSLAQFYRTRFDQLEREWELQTRDMRVGIEYTRVLETPETATVQLQAFLTIQESDRRFYHLQIEDRQGQPVFFFGKELRTTALQLPEDAGSSYFFDEKTQNLYRVFTDRIWLGEQGMGRIALFYRIDNALLQQLATPDVTLTARYRGAVVASSEGERGIAEEMSAELENNSSVKRKSLPWTLDIDNPLNITVSAPVKVLFSTTELAMAVSVIPVVDALILWFVLGTWLMRQARRINGLGDAVREFATEQSHSERLGEQLTRARGEIDDEIHDVADTIEEMVQQNKQRDKERRLWELVFANSNEAILITDSNNKIIAVNPTFCELTGYSTEEILGQNPSILSSGQTRQGFYEEMWQQIDRTGQWQGEILDQRKDGTLYPKWLSIATVKDDQGVISNYVGTFVDITERKRNEERIIHLATHDVLTGLANRMLLLEHISKSIAYAKRHDSLMALLFLDLDRFKWINDSLGHGQGDRLLKGVARRLLDSVRNSDTVARLGGDEFVILLNDIGDMNDVSAAASKIIEQVAYPFTLNGREFHVTTSVGISLYPSDGLEAEQLLKNADAAMYSAKAAGKNQARFFDPRMNQSAVERFEIENGLREALTSQQLQLVYQPKQCLHDTVCGGAEALLRWHHPLLGTIAPDRFIPIAEETGLIIAIGEWVLRHTCEQINSWQKAEINPGVIAVNISAQQLESPNFTEIVESILNEYRIDARSLEFELTESAILQNPQQSIATLETLRALGIRLSLDDFGTGYSSLAYLKRLPVDTVKIDRSFVDGLPHDEDDAQIVRMTVAMAKSIGLMVVAEGVENPEQLGYLKEIGCDLLQGYYIARPLTADNYGQWLSQQGKATCQSLDNCGEKRCSPPRVLPF